MNGPMLMISLAGLIAFGTAIAERVEGDADKRYVALANASLASAGVELAHAQKLCDLRQTDLDSTARSLIHLFGNSKTVKDSL